MPYEVSGQPRSYELVARRKNVFVRVRGNGIRRTGNGLDLFDSVGRVGELKLSQTYAGDAMRSIDAPWVLATSMGPNRIEAEVVIGVPTKFAKDVYEELGIRWPFKSSR